MTTKQKKLQTLVAEKEAKMAALQQLGPKAAVTLQRERQRRYCSNEELAMKIVHLKKQLRTVLHGFDVEEEVSLSDSEAGEWTSVFFFCGSFPSQNRHQRKK